MNTIKFAMEHYVNSLQQFADPFGIGMSVHLAILFVNWVIIYLLTRGLTRNAKSRFWKRFHDLSGLIGFVLAYLLTAAFIWIKNN